MPRLTSEQVNEAITKYRSGLSLVEVGNLFGVSGTAIGGLLKRRGVPLRTLSESHRILACNHRYFDEPMDEGRAYWLGFVLADGTIIERSYGVTEQMAVVLGKEDVGHLEKLRAALGSDHKIVAVRGKTSDCVRFAVSSSELVESLQRLGVTFRKSASHQFSEHVPEDLLRHYFRGYFDGNGGISRHERSQWIVKNAASESFLDRFLEWIRAQIGGYTPGITYAGGIHRVAWTGTHRCREILALMYQDANVFLDRKKALYDAICDEARRSSRGPYNRRQADEPSQ